MNVMFCAGEERKAKMKEITEERANASLLLRNKREQRDQLKANLNAILSNRVEL